jgi:four helix bundle protein
MAVQNIKEMIVYQKAYQVAMNAFEISKRFPAEERYALTGQVRRSSRSVCLNLREAWAKRRYEAHFVSKLTDCDGERNETDSSLDFARDCGYITTSEHAELIGLNQEVGKMLGAMIKNPAPFLLSPVPCLLPSMPDPMPTASPLTTDPTT